jgi:toxin ParE1/3/4
MADYLLTPRARRDLEEIWQFGASRFGADAADRYILGLAHTFDLLARFPKMAPLRRELSPPVRIHSHGRHLILLRDGEPALIARVIHARQDLLSALEP